MSRRRQTGACTPDLEAGLRAEAAARGMDVDALIATAAQAYLRGYEQTAPLPGSRLKGGLVLRHRQTADDNVGVVRETHAIDSISGFQLAIRHERGLVIARDLGSINGA